MRVVDQRKIDTLIKAIEERDRLIISDKKVIDAASTENFLLAVQNTSYKDQKVITDQQLSSFQSKYDKEVKRKKNWRKVSIWSLSINVGLAGIIYLLVK